MFAAVFASILRVYVWLGRPGLLTVGGGWHSTNWTRSLCFASLLARVLPLLCDFFVDAQAGGLSMAARGSAERRRERRMRSWWRHEQGSVRIEIGVQARPEEIDVATQPNIFLVWNCCKSWCVAKLLRQFGACCERDE